MHSPFHYTHQVVLLAPYGLRPEAEARSNAMLLDAFTVIRSQPVVDHVSAIGWDSRRPVAAWVAVSELEAGSGRPLTADEALRQVVWNREQVERIAAAKYERGDYVAHGHLGHDGVRVSVTWRDITDSGEPWRQPPAAGSAWASRDGRFGPRRGA